MSINPSELARMFDRKYVDDPARFDDLPGTTANWPCHKLVILYRMLASEEGHTHEEMAQATGFERSTITRKIAAVDWDKFEEKLFQYCTQSDDEYMDTAAEDFRLKALAKVAMKRRRTEVSNRAMIRHLYETLGNVHAPIDPVQLPAIVGKHTKKTRKDRSPEYMVTLCSDLHVGQEFSNEDTGGLGEYNHRLFLKRAANYRQAIIDLHSKHSEMRPIPKLYVLGLGDNVQGANQTGNWGCAYNSSMSIDEQAKVAADVLSQCLSAWSQVFEEVHFVGVVGNHGRAGEKNMEKVRANWDNVVYLILQGLMSRHDNVHINVANAWWAQVEINGTKFALVHGDEMKGSINGLHNEEQRIQSLLEHPFNVLCAGHYHTHQEIETTNGAILLNGSFVGGDMYSMKKLKVRSRPTQTVLGVHAEHGVTWKYNINLDFKRD